MLPLAASEVVLAVIAAVAVVIVVLATLGYVATQRRRKQTEVAFALQIEAANEQLAAAHAEDNGWAEDRIFAAARTAHAASQGGSPQDHERAQQRDVHLVQVIDRPGTDEDEAICAVLDAEGGRHEVRLGRRSDAWVAL